MVTYPELVGAMKDKMKRDKVSLMKLLPLLNQFIPEDKKLPVNRCGVALLSRWMSFDSKYHVSPRADIVLAFVQWSYGISLYGPKV